MSVQMDILGQLFLRPNTLLAPYIKGVFHISTVFSCFMQMGVTFNKQGALGCLVRSYFVCFIVNDR